VLLGEPERDLFIALLADESDPLISAVTLVEASIVIEAKSGRAGVTDLDALLDAAAVRCVAVDSTQALVARHAFTRFGKGRAPAGLNFGDCFSYALAAVMERSLLYKGADFGKTDVSPAVPA